MPDNDQIFRAAIEATGTANDLARFNRGFMSEQEAEGFLRRAVFAERIAARPKRRRVTLSHAADCPGVEITSPVVRAALSPEQFATLREVEGLAQAIEAPIPELAGLGRYEVHVVCLSIACSYCAAGARSRFVRVTWEHIESGVLVAMERTL